MHLTDPLPDIPAEPTASSDEVTRLADWPSLEARYGLSGTAPDLALRLSMQASRYAVAPGAAVEPAQAAAAADLQAYARIAAQLAQPDRALSLTTTLDARSLGAAATPAYPLATAPFAAFAHGAHDYLAARAAMAPGRAQAGGATVQQMARDLGTTPGGLLAANAQQRYADLFGSAPLPVPAMVAVAGGDTLAALVARTAGLTQAAFVASNAAVPLQAGTELASPQRTVVAATDDSLATLGQADRARTSAAALALANATTPGLLREGVALAFGTASRVLAADDTFAQAASGLGTTVPLLAEANRQVVGLFVPGAVLAVGTLLAAEGDTLQSLAGHAGTDAEALATLNADLPGLWAAGTTVQAGFLDKPAAPAEGASLAAFAAANGATAGQIGTALANASTALAEGATLTLPGTLAHGDAPVPRSHVAAADDTVGSIAEGRTAAPSDIVELNADAPGLIAPGQTVTHAESGRSTVTEPGDTFRQIAGRLEEAGAALPLPALAASVAGQPGLTVPGAVWRCPALRGDAGGRNPGGTFSGLAAACGASALALAVENAAVLGVLEPGVALPLGHPAITTLPHDTLNGIVGRLALQGTQATVADAAAALRDVPHLVAPGAWLVPVPPSGTGGPAVALQPAFGDVVFPVAVGVAIARSGAPAAAEATPVRPAPDVGAALEAALPGVRVASDPAGTAASGEAPALWCVNFANGAGPRFGGFDTAAARHFALAPLCTSPAEGSVAIAEYTGGAGLSDTPQPHAFRDIDLDAWLDTFLHAMDAFPAPAGAEADLATHREALATALAQRVQPLLTGDGGSLEAARCTAREALRERLSAASTAQVFVQVEAKAPVAAAEHAVAVAGNEAPAPRLRVELAALESEAGAFGFSGTSVALQGPGAQATFACTVQSPGLRRLAAPRIAYTATGLELPRPQGVVPLVFSEPFTLAGAAGGEPLALPIPLRSLPDAASLLAQEAVQSVPQPDSAADLSAWDFHLAFRHGAAAQDAPTLVVSFAGEPADPWGGTPPAPAPDAVFAALAQFITAYPVLKGDLEQARPHAAQAFARLAGSVAAALASGPVPRQAPDAPSQPAPVPAPAEPTAIAYRLGQETGAPGQPTRLTVEAIDPATGLPMDHAAGRWPAVSAAAAAGAEAALPQDTALSTPTQAVYAYPPGLAIGATAPLRLVFPGSGEAGAIAGAPRPGWEESPSPGAVKTAVFAGLSVLARQSARAGVSLARNLSLDAQRATNPAFIYRRPITRFPHGAAPSVEAGAPITIGTAPGQGLAQALGTFLQALLALPPGHARQGHPVRMEASVGHVHSVQGGMPVELPVLRVPAFGYDPAVDGDWTDGTAWVARLAASVSEWEAHQRPVPSPEAYYRLALTVLGDSASAPPLIQVRDLRYRPAPQPA
ncbi:LysM peptidoglycan-binding domain-containing protein [Paracidovorax konjaci]|uniref:LysM domain-containing protein n=1 Tax=Paracidovorax konjaci TaxID=32040 RepID=A0A1I1WBJ9_9BURK|nr:LysM peptidoglycan-binding domain-containing protein [Paracidovorax konjaci]SFD92482.1 LysM domain-containing protein [Paracidovorax konjaci]